MIAVVLDQGLAPRAAAILRDRTFDAVHVMEIGMAEPTMQTFSRSLESRIVYV